MTYPVYTYPPDEDQPCTCPNCGGRTQPLTIPEITDNLEEGTVEQCLSCDFTFIYELDTTDYTHTPDAFELIMERLIEQKERELKGLRAEGHLEGLRAALAKYREEGGCPEDSDPGGWNAELLREARERERDSGWEQMGR